MIYKVNKLDWKNALPDFNVKEESDDICKMCKAETPRELEFIGPVFIGDRYIDLCPKCTRVILNLMAGRPPEADLENIAVNRRYRKYISWLIQKGE